MKVCKINMLDVKGECMLYDCKCSEEKCSEWKSLTNYDRIKAMSVEEMAEFLDDMQTDALFLDGTINDLKYPTDWEKWLESEVSE